MTKREEREQLHEHYRAQSTVESYLTLISHEHYRAQSTVESYLTLISVSYKLSHTSQAGEQVKKLHAQEAVKYAETLLSILQKNNEQA